MTPGAARLDIAVDDDLRLHMSRSGSGAPLVLLHGFTGSGEGWAGLRSALADRFTTIAVDLPGHGASSAPDDPARYALSRLADDLARVLDALDIERTALLGYSMGGRCALAFALRHPDRIAALVLESTSPGIDDAGARAGRIASDTALADSIERDGVAAFVNRWERLPLWESQAALPDETRAGLRAQRLANRARGIANSLRGAGAGAEPAVTGRLGELRAPVLLIAGALDQKYVALGQLMEAAIPRARLEVIPTCGHTVHLERTAEFARVVAQFLDSVASEFGQWR